MGTHTIGISANCPHSAYLQALLAANVPIDQILMEAETLGCTSTELVGIAKRLIANQSRETDALAHICLLLGSVTNWEPFVQEGKSANLELLVPLILGSVHPLEDLLGEDRWSDFAFEVLRRLGYPLGLVYGQQGNVIPKEVVAWLDSGMGLVTHELELRDFSASSTWQHLMVDYLVLRDGQGPRKLTFPQSRKNGAPLISLGSAYPGHYQVPGDSARLFRVSGLQALQGLENHTSLVAVDCPDLESLDDGPPTLVLKNCPRISGIPWSRRSFLLHLERCPRIRSIALKDGWDDEDFCALSPVYGTVVLSECHSLRQLPTQMKVERDLLLRRMGPFDCWPENFLIGGDLRLQDCTHIEELPVLEISGSLRVTGKSGLRRLAPGSVVGKHLDLRACRNLEAIPHGVKVGGCLYLPEHLLWSRNWEKPAPLLEVRSDRYPALRTILLVHCFSDLICPKDRLAFRDRAAAALQNLRHELKENPRLETELLWTGSEAWRDLAETKWGIEEPWSSGYYLADVPNSELPLAWFRGVLMDDEPQ